MKRPILLVAILVSLSIIVYKYFGLGIFAVALLLSLALCTVLVERLSYIFIILCIFIGIFFSVFNVNSKIDTSKFYSDKDYEIKCVAISDEVLTDNAKRITVKTTKDNGKLSNTKFNLYYKDKNLVCGQVLSVNVNFMEFDDKGYDLNNGIYGNLWLVNIEKTSKNNKFYYFLGATRKYIKTFLKDNLSYKNQTIVTSIILGDKSMLDEDFYNMVKASGVSHIMAVSGLHLSVILGFLFLVFSIIIRNKYIKFVFSFVSILVISGICGFTPSVLRAGLMFLIFAFASLINRDTDVLSVISFAILIILLSSPMLLFSISFQMSVSAIISVIYVTPFYLKFILKHIKNKGILKVLISAVLVSLLAQVFTMPFAIYNFECISLISVLTNILISVPTTIIIQFTISGMILNFLPFVPSLIMKSVDILTSYIRFIILSLGGLKYSAIAVSRYFCVFPVIVIYTLLALRIILERRETLYGDNRRRNAD